MPKSSEQLQIEGELNSLLINALGWKTIKLDEPEVVGEDAKPFPFRIECWYYVIDHHGRRRNSSAWQTAELAWEHADNPPWAESANAALRLLKDVDPRYETDINIRRKSRHEIAYTCRIHLKDKPLMAFDGYGPTLPIAICRAFLFYLHSHPLKAINADRE
jgi:hypothetical protein